MDFTVQVRQLTSMETNSCDTRERVPAYSHSDWLLGGSAKPFVKQLLDERFNALLKQLPQLLANDTSYCAKDLRSAVESDGTQKDAVLAFENNDEVQQIISDRIKSFRKVKLRETRDLWLGNLCEQLALTVTDVHHVVRFLVDFVNC
jgi:hypothetical protein